MIVAQCFTLLIFKIWEPVPNKLLLTLSFKIWDFGYNHEEISILNNPLNIAYTLHPGSKRAKVLPEYCHLMKNEETKEGAKLVPPLRMLLTPSLKTNSCLYCIFSCPNFDRRATRSPARLISPRHLSTDRESPSLERLERRRWPASISRQLACRSAAACYKTGKATPPLSAGLQLVLGE